MSILMQHHLPSFLVFACLAWGLLLMLFPRKLDALAKQLALLGSLGVFVIAALQLLRMNPDPWGWYISERASWFALVGIPVDYHLAVDGLNLWLILLTTFLVPLTILGTWDSVKERTGLFLGLFLMLEAGMLGAFMAQDLFVFYLFWEAMLVPMFFLIAVWGGQDRIYAATKFLLFTLAGSLLWLVALLYLGSKAHSFAPPLMAQAAAGLPQASRWLFLAFALAFAIKVPLFPLHTWLPDAHTEAPTAGSVILAGVLLKLGGYGFLRFAIPLFPEAALHYAKPMVVLAVIAIVYGAMVALVQRDMKKLVAYSSVSHMGFVMLGIASFTTLGMQGAVMQMLSHGLSTGALFLLVGMLYDRAHTRMIADFGGVASRMPVFTAFFLLVVLSSLGLPLTNGFVGEFLILNGAWVSGGRIAAGIASFGVVLSAAYLLWMFRRVFWGPVNADPDSGTTRLGGDVRGRELVVLVAVGILILWMGIRPRTFLAPSEPVIQRLLQDARPDLPRLAATEVAP